MSSIYAMRKPALKYLKNVLPEPKFGPGKSNVKKVDSHAYRHIGQSSNGVSIEMDLLQVGSEPVGMRCPYCQEDVMTTATYRNTAITHIVAGLLALFFWWLCCCILPYLTKRWKNVEHYCPSCQRFLGVYARTSVI